jgi:hypothetical protein
MPDSAYRPEIEQAMRTFFSLLSERECRLYAAVEAAKLGRGGIAYIASVLNCSERTVRRGLDDLHDPTSVPADRVRREGGAARVVYNP